MLVLEFTVHQHLAYFGSALISPLRTVEKVLNWALPLFLHDLEFEVELFAAED